MIDQIGLATSWKNAPQSLGGHRPSERRASDDVDRFICIMDDG